MAESPVVKTFDELFAELERRAVTRPAGSGTVAALDAGVHAIGKKIVEEAAEVWMAAEHEGRERTAEEISQLLYHLQVLMLATDLSLRTSIDICDPRCGARRGPCAAAESWTVPVFCEGCFEPCCA